MSVFANSIAADQHIPSEGDGYVRAEAIQEAVALVGHPEVRLAQLELCPFMARNRHTAPGGSRSAYRRIADVPGTISVTGPIRANGSN